MLATNERGRGVSNTRFGHQRERQLRKELEADNWLVIRAAGSLGVADLVALKLGHTPRLIEVKADSRSAFAHFGPDKRADLLEAAARGGACAFVVHWPKHGKARWLAPPEWP